MTLRHADSWQLIRNVFFYEGQVMLVTDRDKMKAIRDNGHKVARFLPDGIGRMLLAYIAWLLPMEQTMQRLGGLPEPAKEQREFLWRDSHSKVWGTERLSAVLGRVMQAGTGVPISVARYRPIAIEMGRRIRGMVIRQQDVQAADGDDDVDYVEMDPITGEVVDTGGSWTIIFDIQSTHGTRIARQHDGVHIGFPGQLPPEMIMSFREMSRLWHPFLEHDSRSKEAATRAGTGTSTSTSSKKRPREGSIYSAISVRPKRTQAAAPSHTSCGCQHAHGDNAEAAAATPTRRSVDGETHNPSVSPHCCRCRRAPSHAQGTERVEGATMLYGLRQLLGPRAQWRSPEQEESMAMLLGLRAGESMISVLPTGAGKRILFMVPAVLADGGTSIVVVPFVALVDDLVERAGSMGVDCIRFSSSISAGREGLPRAARLVVVSADVACGMEFSVYADGLACTGLLQRIFVDECHTVITDVSYRAKLGALQSLHRYHRPMVLLTATLPVILEDGFRQAMLVSDASIIRACTAKLNCRYRVVTVPPGPRP